MIRALLVDDEHHAHLNLSQMLASEHPEIQLIGAASSVEEAMRLISEKKPDVVFLDIDLGQGTGFQILDLLKSISFQVIFVTAYSEHAIRAIRYNALDYVLKPIDAQELRTAIERLKIQMREQFSWQQNAQALIDNLQKKEQDQRLVIRNLNGITLIDVNEIVRCEADGHYTQIFLQNGTRVTASRALREFTTLLTEPRFFRTHKSHLVNMKCVWQVTNRDGGTIVLKDQQEIPLARRRKEAFLNHFDIE